MRSEGGAALLADALSAWTAADGRPEAARRLGFQGDVVAYAGYRRLRRLFGGRLVNVGDRVSALRQVKDADELRLLRETCAGPTREMTSIPSRPLSSLHS